ncbi:hypothetical protein GCM10011415_02080 [Salipiger pallidus]|uniref:Uncharacterized protein n=1 Tax=Salipiger pallidus TaxID=1775170 RepID=A0A8J3EET3_9RHOB|nr:hypothetical protein [Salipiger pallidus]GGG59740.1 hypothetical protein GCM10011415_02080 [Salipiger pallidus]
MPIWPASLPFFQSARGARRDVQPDVIRTPMSKGPAKVRRRSSSAPMQRQGRMSQLTLAQLDTFETFFREELGEGVLAFTATDPLDGLERSFRFVGGYSVEPKGVRREVTATLEILP